MSDSEKSPSELWLTILTGVSNILVSSTVSVEVSKYLIICLTITTIVYIVCRTIFKIIKLKSRPDELVNFLKDPE